MPPPTELRRPCPLSPPPSDRTRTPTLRGMLQRCRTERAVDLTNSWLRSKGVSPKHISLLRRARSTQAGSTNLSMPTTTPPIPPVTKLPLQTDLNQLNGSENCTFPAASGPCIERSAAAAAALVTSGSFPIATRRGKSSASALQGFVTWLQVTKKNGENKSLLLKLFSRID